MTEKTFSKGAGIIPDFFHDILAYIIPGYSAIILVVMNNSIINGQGFDYFKEIDFLTISIMFLVAYVIGRFFEQLGKIIIHSKKNNPKWSLIFDEKSTDYTQEFKESVNEKIKSWLINTFDEKFLEECIKDKKDDYFNIIQFYLRERFPAVALYEKKQNANIVLTRSLSLIFVMNIIIYFIMMFITTECENINFSWTATSWILVNLLFSYVFYLRFKQDRKYHAMYIFENFMALKKLLKSKRNSTKNTKK